MKHLKKVLLILLAVVFINNVNAQNEDNPWSVEVGTNAVDFYPTGADDQGDYFDDYFNFDDHWNFGAVMSRIRVGRYIGSGFSIGLAGSINSIEHVGEIVVRDLAYVGADFDIRYNFARKGWFDPYLLVGGGYTWLDSEGNGTLNGGLGINFEYTIGVQTFI
jgi:hypothetical protein